MHFFVQLVLFSAPQVRCTVVDADDAGLKADVRCTLVDADAAGLTVVVCHAVYFREKDDGGG